MKKTLLTLAIMTFIMANVFGQTEPLKATITTTINMDCDGGCFYDGPTILINEISLAPAVGNGSIYSVNGSQGGEWIELYNPHKCDAADISCYFLGNSSRYNGPSSTEEFHGCAYSIPAGTVIPPQGFAVIRGANATPVPAERLVENGGNCVEIVVENGNRICLEGSNNAARLWFADAGSWFAFYDANGVPQDGLYWGPDRGKDKPGNLSAQTACFGCSPCNPNNQVSDCGFQGVLPPLSDFPKNRKYELTQTQLSGGANLTYQRIPDGGQWQPISRADKMGLCNNKCADEPIITCTGTATVQVTGGKPPYTFRWNDRATQTTQTATHLCGGTYKVTITDALGQKIVEECTIENNKPTITCPDTSICFTTDPVELLGLTGAKPAYGWFTGEDVLDSLFLTPSLGKDSYNIKYSIIDSFGCSNTKDFKVKIYQHQATTITDSVCQHQPYTENNFNIDASRTAELTIIHDTLALTSSHGCDSIVDLILTVLPTYHNVIPDMICQNEVYNKYNFLITDSITSLARLYEVSDTLMTKDGCDSIITLKLDIKPAYHNDIIDDVCEGESYERFGLVIAPSQTEDAEDSIRQELRLTSIYGCDSIVTLHLNVIDTNIHIENLTPGDFCEHRNAELTVISDATDYHWNTGETSQTIFANKPGVYSVTAFKDPCTLKAQYHIDNCPFLIFIPNAITANGDGLNDCFFIEEAQTKQMDNFEISIFNRWGQLVFHSFDKDFRWKGDFNGKINRNVVYNYLIYCTDLMGKEYSFRGSITVL